MNLIEKCTAPTTAKSNLSKAEGIVFGRPNKTAMYDVRLVELMRKVTADKTWNLENLESRLEQLINSIPIPQVYTTKYNLVTFVNCLAYRKEKKTWGSFSEDPVILDRIEAKKQWIKAENEEEKERLRIAVLTNAARAKELNIEENQLIRGTTDGKIKESTQGKKKETEVEMLRREILELRSLINNS